MIKRNMNTDSIGRWMSYFCLKPVSRTILAVVAAGAMALGVPARADVDVYFWDEGSDLHMHVDVTSLSTDSRDTLVNSRTRFRSLFSTTGADFAIDDMLLASGPYTELTNATFAPTGIDLRGSVMAANVRINGTGDDPGAIDDGYDSAGGFWFRSNGLVVMDVPGDHRTTGVSDYSFTNRVLGYTIATAGLIDGGTASWTDGRLGAVSISVGSPPPSAAADVEIAFSDDGTNTTVTISGSVNTALLPTPVTVGIQPTSAVWPAEGVVNTALGSGTLSRWDRPASNPFFTRVSGGGGAAPFGFGTGAYIGGSGIPNTGVTGNAFGFSVQGGSTGGGRLELPSTYVSGASLSATMVIPNKTVADLGIVDTDYSFLGGQILRISGGIPAPEVAVEINFADDGTNTTVTVSGSVDTALLPAPATVNVQPTSAVNPAQGGLAAALRSGSLSRWDRPASDPFFTRVSGGAGVAPLGFGTGAYVGGSGIPANGVTGDVFSFGVAGGSAGGGRIELPATYVSGAPLSATMVIPNKTVADLGIVDTDYSFLGGQILRISGGSPAPSGPTIEIGSATTTQSGVANLPITLIGSGDEFAIAGSIDFDPAVFSNPQLSAGSGAPASTTVATNLTDASSGRVGFAVYPPFGETFAAGTSVILNLQLTANAQAPKMLHAVTFGDAPAAREVADNLGDSITATWADGTVNVINRDPVANDDLENTNEDTVLNVAAPGVLDNDVELDFGDTLTVNPAVSATTPGGASVSISSDGTISYDPTGSTTLNALPQGGSYDDTVDYSISDGDGGSDTATLRVTVAGVNDAPIAEDDATAGATNEDVALDISGVAVLGNDSDPDTGDTFSIASVDATSANGATLSLNGDGSINYDATEAPAVLALADGVELVDTFTYTIEDALGLQDTATASVTVSGVEYEGDLTPRPHGDNSVDATDLVMAFRFVVGLDTPAVSEFSRADTFPRTTGGDGVLTLGDAVQTLRYAVGVDSVKRVQGPTEPAAALLALNVRETRDESDPGKATLSINPTVTSDGRVELSIDMDSTGQVSALGFSVAFDPEIHSYDEYAISTTTAGVTTFVNTDQATNGRLGVVIANSDVGQTFQGSKVRLLTLKLSTISRERLKDSHIQFEDFPAARAVADSSANRVDTAYMNASLAAVVDPKEVPAAWLQGYFDPTVLNDASKESSVWGAYADPDGDGQSNYAEYVSGTSPTDRNSTFDTQIEKRGDAFAVSFYPFHETRNYKLLFKQDLADADEWTTVYSNISSRFWQPTLKKSTQEEGRTTTIDTNGKTGYFRVQVSLPNP
ncbi:MAG: Ig-like domain-containing protein [Verrucomicrobiales bacterium]